MLELLLPIAERTLPHRSLLLFERQMNRFSRLIILITQRDFERIPRFKMDASDGKEEK